MKEVASYHYLYTFGLRIVWGAFARELKMIELQRDLITLQYIVEHLRLLQLACENRDPRLGWPLPLSNTIQVSQKLSETLFDPPRARLGLL